MAPVSVAASSWTRTARASPITYSRTFPAIRSTGRWRRVRIDASEIQHILEPLAPGQVRGLPWLTPVLLRLHELDQYEDAQLVRQKVAALFAGFLMDPDGNASTAFAGDTANGVMTSGLEPGTLKVLPPGYDIKFSDPAETGDNYKPFIDQQLRSIAAGIALLSN